MKNQDEAGKLIEELYKLTTGPLYELLDSFEKCLKL